jgi:hypothetical protein
VPGVTRDDSLAEYRILVTRSSFPTAVHVPTGILLHSLVDPVAEARTVATERVDAQASRRAKSR